MKRLPFAMMVLGVLWFTASIGVTVVPSILGSATTAFAAACTHGVNCYCDRVKNPSNPIYDPNLLFCEDFEALTLHDDVGFGQGSPDYGPWYDDTGFTGNRGNNSYWSRHYGAEIGTCSWHSPNPVTPQRGTACAFGSCNAGAWRKDNLWNANTPSDTGDSSGACITILRNGEFQDEVSSLQTPTNTSSGVPGVFDGQQTMAHRIGPGSGSTAGLMGHVPFAGGARTTFGVTMAVAYPTNSATSGIFGGPWKHNEFSSVANPNGGWDPILLSHVGILGDSDPLGGIILFLGASLASCQNQLARATVRRGNEYCDDSSFKFFADTNYYKQSRDWPFGTWGCVRGYFQNFGTTNVSVQIWFTGPAGNEILVVDFSGMDDTGFDSRQGYDGFYWNAYSNVNQPGGGATTQTAFRYEDNIHVTAGPPVSCGQIGFVSRQIPSAPSGLQVR